MKALAHVLLRLYPQAWQDRYGDELAELLEQYPVAWRTLASLLAGALDAHLHPELLPGGVAPVNRSPVLLVAAILFSLGWLPMRFLLPAGSDTSALQWCSLVAILGVGLMVRLRHTRWALLPGALATAAMWGGIGTTIGGIPVPSTTSWWLLVCSLVQLGAATAATWALVRGLRALRRGGPGGLPEIHR